MLDRLLGEAAGGAEAGVCEDDVDAPEPLERGGGGRLDLIPLGDVARDGVRPLGAELADEPVERLLAPRAASTTRSPACTPAVRSPPRSRSRRR